MNWIFILHLIKKLWTAVKIGRNEVKVCSILWNIRSFFANWNINIENILFLIFKTEKLHMIYYVSSIELIIKKHWILLQISLKKSTLKSIWIEYNTHFFPFILIYPSSSDWLPCVGVSSSCAMCGKESGSSNSDNTLSKNSIDRSTSSPLER